MKRLPLPAFFLLALMLSAAWLHAGQPKEWKPNAWKVPKEQFNVIKAVNAAAGTVSISHMGGKDKQDRDLTTTVFTEIVVDGKKATLADLKPGMHVDYTLGSDGSVAAKIETKAELAPPPTPAPTATPSFPHSAKNKPAGQ